MQAVFLDLTNPGDIVPQVNGNVICKILRLDNVKCSVRHAFGLQTRDSIPKVPVRSSSMLVVNDATAATNKNASPPNAVTASESSAVLDSPSVVEAGMSQAVEEDDDLRDKSAAVQALIRARRAKLREEQARRVAEISEREAAAKQEQEDSENARMLYGAKLKEWAEEASGAKKNIRVLLSTLQHALWPDSKWEPVPMAKLIEPRRVRMAFLKAVTIVHPDKQTSMDPTHKHIATQIFHYLETSFRIFQDTEMGTS